MAKKTRPALPPRELTPDLAAKIVAGVRGGCFPETAAAAEGVWEDVFAEWVARGQREQSGPYRELVQAIEDAERELIERALTVIRDAANSGDRKAARWLRERGIPPDEPAP